jgi:hypothetical protein
VALVREHLAVVLLAAQDLAEGKVLTAADKDTLCRAAGEMESILRGAVE